MGVDGVISVSMFQYDGEAIGPELTYQPDLASLHRLDLGADRSCYAHPIPPDDPAARKGVSPEAIDDRALDWPIELAQVSRGNRPWCSHCPAQGPPGQRVPPRTFQGGQQPIE